MDIIYDNIIYSLQKAGGISTYWSELSKRLIRDKVNVRFVERENDNITRKNISIKGDQIIKGSTYPLILDRFLPIALPSIENFFIFHSSYNRVTNNKSAMPVITIHDFVHEKFYSGLRKLLHSRQKNKALTSAKFVIAVSNNTKNDILKLHPNLHPDKIRVIYNGVSDDFYIADKQHTGKPYLLFVGSREHYKNFDFVVKLLKELPEFDLYIVGKPLTGIEQTLLTGSLGDRFKILTNVTNAELNLLYNSAYALLYPSSYEGFGIPLLEAMKTGLPFIALNGSSIPEVAGNAGELINELDINAFKEAIYNIDSNREDYIAKGLKQANFFSWEKCYQQTIEVYKNLPVK